MIEICLILVGCLHEWLRARATGQSRGCGVSLALACRVICMGGFSFSPVPLPAQAHTCRKCVCGYFARKKGRKKGEIPLKKEREGEMYLGFTRRSSSKRHWRRPQRRLPTRQGAKTAPRARPWTALRSPPLAVCGVMTVDH